MLLMSLIVQIQRSQILPRSSEQVIVSSTRIVHVGGQIHLGATEELVVRDRQECHPQLRYAVAICRALLEGDGLQTRLQRCH